MSWLTRLYLRWRNRHDPALEQAFQDHGGHVRRFTGHDEAGAATRAQQAAREVVSRRKLAAQRAKPSISKARAIGGKVIAIKERAR